MCRAMEDMRNQTLKEGMINQMSPRENISFQGMMKPILNIVDTADDLETLREALKDDKAVGRLYEEMDSPELEDVLHQAMYLSELIGRSME